MVLDVIEPTIREAERLVPQIHAGTRLPVPFIPAHSARVETIPAHRPPRVDPPFEGSHCQLAVTESALLTSMCIQSHRKYAKTPGCLAELHRMQHCPVVQQRLVIATVGDDSTVSGSPKGRFSQMPLDSAYRQPPTGIPPPPELPF